MPSNWRYEIATEPFEKILNRSMAVANVRRLAELSSPLLQEVVNHGTNAFARCQLGVTGEEGVDMAPFILYRQVLELTDAIDVLLTSSCVSSTIPLLRSSLEASLGLEYLLSGTSAESRLRALSWLCVYIHKRLDLYGLIDPDRSIAAAEIIHAQDDAVSAGEAKRRLAKSLKASYMEPVEREYQGLLSRRKDPPWFSLFGGPPNLRELAKRFRREREYTHLYKHWSTFSHGGDASTGFTKAFAGGVAFKGLRSPEQLVTFAQLAAHFQLSATRLMIQNFRAGENLEKWYVEEVRPRQEALRSVEVQIERVEWEGV